MFSLSLEIWDDLQKDTLDRNKLKLNVTIWVCNLVLTHFFLSIL